VREAALPLRPVRVRQEKAVVWRQLVLAAPCSAQHCCTSCPRWCGFLDDHLVRVLEEEAVKKTEQG